MSLYRPAYKTNSTRLLLSWRNLAIVFLVYATFLCAWSFVAPASAQSAASQPYTVKVGAILPLSGELAQVGNDIREGITLAFEEHNSTKVKFEFLWEDGRFSKRDSVSAARKMIAVDKVDVLISLWDTADVIAPIAEQHKVIQLSIRWNPDVAARHRFTFTFESTYKTYFEDVLKLLQQEHIEKAAFIMEDQEADADVLNFFMKTAQRLGIEVVGHASFPAGTTDFRSILTRLLSYSPQIVVVEAFPPANSTIIRTLRNLNPTIRHTGSYETLPDSPLIEGVPFVSQIGFIPEFSQKFEQRFGHRFQIRAPHGYELVRILDWAYTHAAGSGTTASEKPSSTNVAQQLEQLKEFPSILGPLSTSKTRNIEHPNTVKVMRNGKLVPYPG
jgi:branched-chain amino acid transport system substrate-binding protein